jgi:hypothetical protein
MTSHGGGALKIIVMNLKIMAKQILGFCEAISILVIFLDCKCKFATGL